MKIDEKILSIDSEDEIDYETFEKYIVEHVSRDKNKMANEFNEFGNDLLAEIDSKNHQKNIVKKKQIAFILKRSKLYSQHTLNSYSFEDVENIFNELKNDASFFKKVISFIFNL